MSLERFGVLLNAEFPHRELMAYARLADDLGFGSLWYADERFYRETYTGLAACALSTQRIRLGTGVTDPFTRHPAITAAAIASLDDLSEGRAILGYGAGLSGYHNLGIRLVRPARRMREAVRMIRGLWAGETVTVEGETIVLRNARMKFPTRADIPISLAADGPIMLRLAGELGDSVITAHCAGTVLMSGKAETVREGAARAGRLTPPIIARLDMTIANDGDAAVEYAKLRIGRVLWSRYPDNLQYIADNGLTMPAELDRRLREAGPFPTGQFNLEAFRFLQDAIPSELVHLTALAGSPEQVAEQMDRTFAAGAAEIMVFPLLMPGETVENALRLFADAATRCQSPWNAVARP